VVNVWGARFTRLRLRVKSGYEIILNRNRLPRQLVIARVRSQKAGPVCIDESFPAVSVSMDSPPWKMPVPKGAVGLSDKTSFMWR
jgi:hypothetical protein